MRTVFGEHALHPAGAGLPGESVDYAMLFNILHAEDPQVLLCEARRILRPAGRVAVMHWNHDPNTPRGPSTVSYTHLTLPTKRIV